ncbi:MAG TPA: DUF1449 family protein [Bacteroidetes bacterium]|nr:DUF1449 family protein [Bacteroidota bacterium]
MKELFDLSFSPANVFSTILLLFVALYWLVFLFGMLDLSFMDFELEADAGMEIDVDADVDIGMDKDLHVESDMGKDLSGHVFEPGPGARILRFLNLGDIPFMIFFSFFALFFWAMSILGNHYWAGGETLNILGLGLAAFLVSLLLTKLVTQPFRKLFREMGKGAKQIDFRGKLCVLELGMQGQRLGQADVIVNDKHFLINVRSEAGIQLDSGMRCLIIDRTDDEETYIVQQFSIEEP